jgi:hypothetical protein
MGQASRKISFKRFAQALTRESNAPNALRKKGGSHKPGTVPQRRLRPLIDEILKEDADAIAAVRINRVRLAQSYISSSNDKADPRDLPKHPRRPWRLLHMKIIPLRSAAWTLRMVSSSRPPGCKDIMGCGLSIMMGILAVLQVQLISR